MCVLVLVGGGEGEREKERDRERECSMCEVFEKRRTRPTNPPLAS